MSDKNGAPAPDSPLEIPAARRDFWLELMTGRRCPPPSEQESQLARLRMLDAGLCIALRQRPPEIARA